MDTQDTEEDLHDFLHALYFPAYTNRHRLLDEFELARSDFPGMYQGILELSQKYDARDLRKVIASAICEQWPPQLWRWDDRDAVIRKSLKSLKDPRKDVTRFYPNPAQTIHLGMKYNIPSILPLAFYDLSRVHEFDTDGTTHRRVSDLETLDADDFKRFIRGRASLRTRLFSLDPKQGRSGVCKRTSRDSTVCVDQAESFWTKRFAQIHRSSDPLDLLNLSVLPGETLNLCDGCRPVFAAAAEQRRQRLWEELPDFFNLRGLVGNDWGKVQV